MIDLRREKRLIAVELSEYHLAMRQGNVLRALACLNQANELGKALAQRLNAEPRLRTQNGH